MIITHGDADGWCSAGIFLLTDIGKKEKIELTRYATVRYINILLKQLLTHQDPCKIYIFDLNSDNSENYKNLLIKLSKKGFQITLYDHHPIHSSFDKAIEENGVKVIRDISVCCSELVYREFKDDFTIKDQNKAEFLMCIGAIGDKRITKFVQEKMYTYRWEELFDLYAVLVAGIRDGHDFLNSVLKEKDKNGIGFTKKIYSRATRKRFWLEKIKSEVLKNCEKIDNRVYIIHIFKKYIGLAAGFLIDQSDIDYAIAIGDRSPTSALNQSILFFKEIFGSIFKRKKSKDDKMVRISIRSNKSINKIITKLAKSSGGHGGGHKFACGARIPKNKMNFFLKSFMKEIK